MPTSARETKLHSHMPQHQNTGAPKTDLTEQEQKVMDLWGSRSTHVEDLEMWKDHRDRAEEILVELGFAWNPAKVLHIVGVSQAPPQLAALAGQVKVRR